MKTRLLVTELWGLGDLAIASQFLAAASQRYDVLLVAKPYAQDLAAKLWPSITVLPFVAPWTQFRGKYRLHRWPWRQLKQTLGEIRAFQPSIAAAGRCDPRDHVLLRLSGAPQRVGFPRTGSQLILTQSLPPVPRDANRSAQWQLLADHLDLPLESQRPLPSNIANQSVVIHSGAAQAVRVWPLDRYRELIEALRNAGWKTTVLCDPTQQDEWQALGELPICPQTPKELLDHLGRHAAFVGNDSGPGHIAAALGLPTFTIFGPQRPEWFLPNHPSAGWIEGKPCEFKPCFDYCRFPRPHCLLDNEVEEVWSRMEHWLQGLTRAATD